MKHAMNHKMKKVKSIFKQSNVKQNKKYSNKQFESKLLHKSNLNCITHPILSTPKKLRLGFKSLHETFKIAGSSHKQLGISISAIANRFSKLSELKLKALSN